MISTATEDEASENVMSPSCTRHCSCIDRCARFASAWLVGCGEAVRLPGDIILPAIAYQAMVQWIGQQLRTDGQIAVGQVRDQFQTTRRFALAVLEQLDAQRITRRIGDVRVAYRR